MSEDKDKVLDFKEWSEKVKEPHFKKEEPQKPQPPPTNTPLDEDDEIGPFGVSSRQFATMVKDHYENATAENIEEMIITHLVKNLQFFAQLMNEPIMAKVLGGRLGPVNDAIAGFATFAFALGEKAKRIQAIESAMAEVKNRMLEDLSSDLSRDTTTDGLANRRMALEQLSGKLRANLASLIEERDAAGREGAETIETEPEPEPEPKATSGFSPLKISLTQFISIGLILAGFLLIISVIV